LKKNFFVDFYPKLYFLFNRLEFITFPLTLFDFKLFGFLKYKKKTVFAMSKYSRTKSLTEDWREDY